MKTIRRPAFFFGVVAMDVGFVDQTGILLGWVDFTEARIVWEGEALLSHASTQAIADTVEAMEREAFGPDKFAGGYRQPYKRISDVDHRLVADLQQAHDLSFSAIEKKNLDADVNLTNILITNKQMLVSEKCVHLRRQLASGTWNKTKKDMARDSGQGHFDLLAALRYGNRVAEPLLRRSPFPEGWKQRPPHDDLFTPIQKRRDSGFLPDTPLARRMKARFAVGRGIATRGRR